MEGGKNSGTERYVAKREREGQKVGGEERGKRRGSIGRPAVRSGAPRLTSRLPNMVRRTSQSMSTNGFRLEQNGLGATEGCLRPIPGPGKYPGDFAGIENVQIRRNRTDFEGIPDSE